MGFTASGFRVSAPVAVLAAVVLISGGLPPSGQIAAPAAASTLVTAGSTRALESAPPHTVQTACFGTPCGHLVRPEPQTAAHRPASLSTAGDDAVDRALIGTWIWSKDSNGSHPSTGSQCTLLFVARGSATLSCTRPSEVYNDPGTYQVSGVTTAGGKITLQLSQTGISLAAQAYSYAGGKLILPFKLMSDGTGTSTWRRPAALAPGSQDVASVAYAAFDQAVAGGDDYDAAARAALAALKEHSFSSQDATGKVAGAAALAAQKSAFDFALTDDYSGIVVKTEGGRTYGVWLTVDPLAMAAPQYSSPKPMTMSMFATDPRTHLLMQASSGKDDPVHHSAQLLFGFYNQREYSRPGEVTYALKDNGESPTVLKQDLVRAGYPAGDVTVRVDTEFTPRTLYDALISDPGVLYISSHSGIDSFSHIGDISTSYVLATGQRFIRRAGDGWSAGAAPPEGLIRQMLQEEGLPQYLWKYVRPLALREGPASVDWFLAVYEGFFKAVQAQNQGWKASRSLVYVDACYSAKLTHFSDLFKPGVFVGWSISVESYASVHIAQHFFSNLVRKTHSAREVWYETKRVLSTFQEIYPEDKLVDTTDAGKQALLQEAIHSWVMRGADGAAYKPYSDVVNWLAWLGRWNQIPESASKNLQSCFDQYWSHGTGGGLASAMCNAGVLGSHVPTADEVREARQLIDGEPAPVPGGRWTLADGLPYGK